MGAFIKEMVKRSGLYLLAGYGAVKMSKAEAQVW